MNRFASFVCCVVAIALVGCKKDATFTEPIGDFAGITWANLVPDTGKLDVRVIDIVSNAGLYQADFRTSLIYPQGIEAGTRHIAGHDRRGGCVDQARHRDVDGNAGRDERRVWHRVPVRRARYGPV